ncbi:YraN family protein [Stutzerimonas urumqiensis]|uniref:YraN family protein n=1 Tax=Stutzerimonas urumqiensis TaxID=638269 RepID=UPI000EB5608B|nr:YraN family protein [Stutzerimonas urumqiensis]
MLFGDRQSKGRTAEDHALSHLKIAGLRLIARNWLARTGELDLVMLDGDTVVFVEVRYRSHSAWGGAAASIDRRKQHKLINTAECFLQQEKRWSKSPCRFDVIAIGPIAEHPAIEWIKNAFDS